MLFQILFYYYRKIILQHKHPPLCLVSPYLGNHSPTVSSRRERRLAAGGRDGSALDSCRQRGPRQPVSWAAGVRKEHTQTAAVIGFRSGVSGRLRSMAMTASLETATVWIHLFLQPLEFTQTERLALCRATDP